MAIVYGIMLEAGGEPRVGEIRGTECDDVLCKQGVWSDGVYGVME
jgi:hypothetical protein